MGRPQKEGLDYFPLDVDIDQDDKIALIEAQHGIAGFGVVIKMFMKIYKNGYFYQWGEKEQLLFSKRVNVDINSINAIINDCLKWGLFDAYMYETYGILTSRGIQRRYFEAVSRRQNVTAIEEYCLIDAKTYSNVVYVSINHLNVNGNTPSTLLSDDINPQSKGKESKVKEIERESRSFDADDASVDLEDSTNKTPDKTLAEKRFDEFWAAYPKKVGKKAAWASWKKIKPNEDLFNKIMDAVNRAKITDQWTRENGRYIPNPTTWLNQGRWDDEYEEVPINGKSRTNISKDDREAIKSNWGRFAGLIPIRDGGTGEDIGSQDSEDTAANSEAAGSPK